MIAINLSDYEVEVENNLKEYGVSQNLINEFQSKIKKDIPNEEKEKLGEELFNLISKRGYNEEASLEDAIELIYKGANVNFKTQEKGDFPLLICARKNYLKTFILLIQAGADVHLANNFLTTSLMAAARHGCVDMVKILLLLGVDVNARCQDGYTAIMSAKKHDQEECFNLLINANSYLNNRDLVNNSLMNIQSKTEFPLSSLCKALKEDEEELSVSEIDVQIMLDEAQKVLNEKGLVAHINKTRKKNSVIKPEIEQVTHFN